MSEFEALAAVYGVTETEVTVLLLGGPWDGQERQVATRGRSYHQVLLSLLSYWLPLPPSQESGFVPAEEVFRVALQPSQAGYGLMSDGVGMPSRDDQGRLRLKFQRLL